MNKIITIITIGAVTASLQLHAQETKPVEEQANPKIEQDVLDERAQPSADYQHNQYGTYPQGDEDLDVIPQIKTEIRRDDLPKSVMNSFESGEYSDQEIVAIYVVNEETSEMQSLSNETADPTYHNDLNERSRIESGNNIDGESMEEMVPTTQTETITDENDEEGNAINPRPSDTEISSGTETTEVVYEIEVKHENTNTILTYSEEGELMGASEESDM